MTFDGNIGYYDLDYFDYIIAVEVPIRDFNFYVGGLIGTLLSFDYDERYPTIVAKNKFNKMEYGLVGGIGYKVERRFELNIEGYFGLSQVDTNDNPVPLTNGYISFTFAYTILRKSND